MTARELLRYVASDISDGLYEHPEAHAAALRQLADRIDAETAWSAPGGQTYGMLKFQKEGAAQVLARLDAPLEGKPR